MQIKIEFCFEIQKRSTKIELKTHSAESNLEDICVTISSNFKSSAQKPANKKDLPSSPPFSTKTSSSLQKCFDLLAQTTLLFLVLMTSTKCREMYAACRSASCERQNGETSNQLKKEQSNLCSYTLERNVQRK